MINHSIMRSSKRFRGYAAMVTALFLFTIVFVSCGKTQNAENVISDAFALADKGDYKGAQLKALRAEELMSDNSSLKDRESLSRLYGLIFYQQNIRDKAEGYNRQALECAVGMNDTSLIIINMFNLGLCAKTAESGILCFEQAAVLAYRSGNRMQQVSALEKLAQVYISVNDYARAQQLLDESVELCKNNNLQQGEIGVTQCRLWLAEGKWDLALQGYKSMNPESLNIHGRLMRVNAICEILLKKEDYRNVLLYKDSVYLYADSIRRLDGSKRVEEIEREYHDGITQKNAHFKMLLWLSVSVLAVTLIILIIVLKNLRLKKRQVELTDKISALNAKMAELMSHRTENDDQEDVDRNDAASISILIEQKLELSLELFKNHPEYRLLKKLNLIKELTSDNRVEVKSVYDVIVGRFSDCCSDVRQAFPGMTNDDCIYCVMNFAGCGKEVIATALGSSEEALRRRKSRIKQKLPEDLFRLFFFKR